MTEREQGVHRKSKQTKSCPSRKRKRKIKENNLWKCNYVQNGQKKIINQKQKNERKPTHTHIYHSLFEYINNKIIITGLLVHCFAHSYSTSTMTRTTRIDTQEATKHKDLPPVPSPLSLSSNPNPECLMESKSLGRKNFKSFH